MALHLVGAPEREAEPFALMGVRDWQVCRFRTAPCIPGEHPLELARRALYAAAEAEARDWAEIILRFADALPPRAACGR